MLRVSATAFVPQNIQEKPAGVCRMSEEKKETENTHPVRPWLGLMAAFGIVMFWSGWLVTSRAGVQSSLTVYDLLAFRFGIATLLTLPFVLYAKPWRHMTFQQIWVTTAAIGLPYSFIIFSAFQDAPAAHGAVFMNGMLPPLIMLLAFIMFREKPSLQHILGAILIIVGASFAGFGIAGFDIATTWFGDLLFMVAGSLFAIYMILNRVWHLTVTQIWLCGSVLNAIVFMPIYWLFLPSGISETSMDQLWFQAAYQGIVPNIIGLVLIAIAVRNVGPSVTAALMSGVPGIGAFLAFVFLGETPTWLGIVSLMILTPGVIISSLPNLRKTKPAGVTSSR